MLQNEGVDASQQQTPGLLDFAAEVALLRTIRNPKVSAGTVSRGRQDPAHPAYRPSPDEPFTDPRTTVVTKGAWVKVLAPEDSIRAFWASRRRGPKPSSTTPQEQQQ